MQNLGEHRKNSHFVVPRLAIGLLRQNPALDTLIAYRLLQQFRALSFSVLATVVYQMPSK